MLYLNEADLQSLSLTWHDYLDTIEVAVACLREKAYVQPVKPYLRYKDRRNRIIAMPAYLGHTFDMAGIKWIASFPGNLLQGLPRAHSVVVLNEADTGRPLAFINTPLLSILRTAAVSGLVMRQFLKTRASDRYEVGIIGWGPIGRHHYQMCRALLGPQLGQVKVFDLQRPTAQTLEEGIVVVDSWQEAYRSADIFMTCTVADAAYIDLAPKAGSLHLNVSLRDYKAHMLSHFMGGIVVDDWDEVCRENTDIERMHLEMGLRSDQVLTLGEFLEEGRLDALPEALPILFNPMGMAIFDIAMGTAVFREALRTGLGVPLD